MASWEALKRTTDPTSFVDNFCGNLLRVDSVGPVFFLVGQDVERKNTEVIQVDGIFPGGLCLIFSFKEGRR